MTRPQLRIVTCLLHEPRGGGRGDAQPAKGSPHLVLLQHGLRALHPQPPTHRPWQVPFCATEKTKQMKKKKHPVKKVLLLGVNLPGWA